MSSQGFPHSLRIYMKLMIGVGWTFFSGVPTNMVLLQTTPPSCYKQCNATHWAIFKKEMKLQVGVMG